jgi:hypothetical protein
LLPNTGNAGVGFTNTVTVLELVQGPSVAVTVYTPLAVTDTSGITIGFCKREVYDAGPAQLNRTPAVASAENNFSVSRSEHIGALVPMVGCIGVESIRTITVELSMQPLSRVTTLYMPEWVTNAGLIVGFCKVDKKLRGPVQVNPTPVVNNVADNKSALPEHIGPLLLAVTNGNGLSITLVLTVSRSVPTIFIA